METGKGKSMGSKGKVTYTLQMTRPDITGMPTPVGIWHLSSLKEVHSTIQEFLATREAQNVTGLKVAKTVVGPDGFEVSTEIARIENVNPATPRKYRTIRTPQIA